MTHTVSSINKSTQNRSLSVLRRTLWLYMTEIQLRVNLLTHITEESGVFLLQAVLDPVSQVTSSGIFSFFSAVMHFSKQILLQALNLHGSKMVTSSSSFKYFHTRNSRSESSKLESDVMGGFIWVSLNPSKWSGLDHRPFNLSMRGQGQW